MNNFKDKKKFYENKEIIFNYNTPVKNINTENNMSRDTNINSFKNNNKDTTIYNKRLKSNGNFTAGRGFGNLSTNNIIRFGKDSRSDKKIYSNHLEKKINNRFDYIFDDNKQKAHANNILNIGGESTRKQQLNSGCIFDHTNIKNNNISKKDFPFNY